MYKGKPLNRKHLEIVRKFYNNSVKVDIVEKTEQKKIHNVLKTILGNSENGGRFSVHPTAEGSAAVGLQVAKKNELDFSIEIELPNEHLHLSYKPIEFEFKHGDVDSKSIDKITTEFVKGGKRYFPEKERSLRSKHNPPGIPNGYIAVCIGEDSRFSDCCIRRGGKDYLLPYLLLSEFRQFLENAILEQNGVTLKRGARGPALTLRIKHDDGPDISVDITPKLTLSNKTLSDTTLSWPRRDTERWLTKERIDEVACRPLYLVPKGDKYWKISFANCENEIFRDIDVNGSCRKRCLRIMKKILMRWKSKSSTGLDGLDSYLLKTTLLWLCEKFPNDKYWSKENMGRNNIDFLREFAKRLRSRRLPEYFNPSVNLLENKDEECIDELVQFLEEEISVVQDGTYSSSDTDTSDDTDVEDL